MKDLITEQQLLSRIAGDDREAFEIIYDRYWDELYEAAGRRLHNTAQAEDIVQEIFVRLWERRADLQVKDLTAYLHTAVRYKVYNYISRDAVAGSFYEPFNIITTAGADAVIIEKELLHLAAAYITALPAKRRRIFNLYFNDDLSTGEIADRLNISQKTVQNQIGLAMNGLRASLLPVLLFILFLFGLPR